MRTIEQADLKSHELVLSDMRVTLDLKGYRNLMADYTAVTPT